MARHWTFTAAVIGWVAVAAAQDAAARPAGIEPGPAAGAPVDLGEAAVLPGTWLGRGAPLDGCGRVFTLSFRADLAEPGTILADAGGSLPPFTLKGRRDATRARFVFEPVEWHGRGKPVPYRLEVAYLGARDLLQVDRIGPKATCSNLVAARLALLPAPINPDGLLFKASTRPNGLKETLKAVREEDCLGYARWVTGHDGPVTADSAAMVAVLGADLLRWTDEYAARYRNLVRTCRHLLEQRSRSTMSPEDAALLEAAKGRLYAFPLKYPPGDAGSTARYTMALADLNAPLLRDLAMVYRLLTEGLLGPDGAEVASATRKPDGLLFTGYLDGGFVPYRLTVEDCIRFYRWQTDYESYHIGTSQVYGGFFDPDRLVATFGKPLDDWTVEDGNIAKAIRRTCPDLVASSGDGEAQAALEASRAADNYYSWYGIESPPNTPQGAHSWETIHELMADVLTNSGEVRARLAELEAAPASLPLVARIDELSAAVTPPRGAASRYLTESERDEIAGRLSAARSGAGVSLANAALVEIAGYPATLDGLKRGQERVEALDKTLGVQGLVGGQRALAKGWRAAAEARTYALWPSYVAAVRADLDALEGADFGQWHVLAAQAETIAFIGRFADLAAAPSEGQALGELSDRRSALADAMLDRSGPALTAWAAGLPPSEAADAAFEALETAVAAAGGDLGHHPDLAQAMAATRAAYNPLGLSRPDIAGSLMDRRWGEVALGSLEDIAYLVTALRRFDDECHGLVEATLGSADAGRVVDFTMRLGNRAVQQAVTEGPRNQSEGMRMMMMFFHNIANQPGCRIDYYGNVTRCVSEEEFAAGNEALLYSGNGSGDAGRLMSDGCGDDNAGAFLSGLSAYVDIDAAGGAGRFTVPGFEEALAD